MSLGRWWHSEVTDDPLVDKLDWCDYYQQNCDDIAGITCCVIFAKHLKKTSFEDVVKVYHDHHRVEELGSVD